MKLICSKCKRELDVKYFDKSKSKKSGYNSWCKECRKKDYEYKRSLSQQKETIPEGYKRCGKCKQIKLLSEFDKSSAYGYQSYCKDCKKQKYYEQEKHEPSQTGTKICSCCGKEKDISEFSISRQNKDGHLSRCKKCISKYDASRIFPIQQEGTKYCPRCKQILPITEFSIARGNPTGRAYSCRKCSTEFVNELVDKCCEICGKSYKGKRERDKYCPECKIKYGNHTEPEWEMINILNKYNIKYLCEYGVENMFWFDFFLPDFNLVIDINPTYTHAATKIVYPAKRKYYHWDKRRLANKNGFRCICLWDWDSKEDIIKAVIENKLIIEQNKDIKKHWNILKTTEHLIDNNFNEEEMIAEGWRPVYDDGQTLIY